MPTTIPIAVATDNLSGALDAETTLDGTGSYDPSSVDIDSYEWVLLSKPPGSSATLTSPTTATPKIVPDIVGSYRVRLQVTTDDGRESDISRTAPDSAFCHIRVTTPNNDWTVPADGERGWSSYLHEILVDADTFLGASTDITDLSLDGDESQIIFADGEGGSEVRNIVPTDVDTSGLSLSTVSAGSDLSDTLESVDDLISELDTDVESLNNRVDDLEVSGNSVTLPYTGTAIVGEVLAINSSGTLVKAVANSVSTVNVVGFISSKSSTEATLTTGNTVTLTGLTTGAPYYISATTGGQITDSPPATTGQVIRQVGIALSSTTLLIQHFPPILL